MGFRLQLTTIQTAMRRERTSPQRTLCTQTVNLGSSRATLRRHLNAWPTKVVAR